MASFVAHYNGSLLEREGMVSSVMALRPSVRASEAAADEVSAAVPAAACGGGADRGVAGVFEDEFSVEALLNLDGLEDCAELGNDAAAEHGAMAAEEQDKLSGESKVSSSVLSYEPMALPVQDQMADLPLPSHDDEDLEWVSFIMDDSLAELPPAPKLPAAGFVAAARLPLDEAAVAPRPAMRRSPNQTICALSTEELVRVKAKRSKRSRGSVWPISGGAPMSESATSSYCTPSWASCSPLLLLPAPDSSSMLLSSSNYFLHEDNTRPAKNNYKQGTHGSKNGGKHKNRGSKPTKHNARATDFAGGAGAGASALAAQQGYRRCSHCGVNKTPQWRAGPEGAKTLCNACGVRYKSGRLLPEYRPACSPTFVSTIHSNFHRKVLEMRRHKEDVHGPVQKPIPLAPVQTAALLGLGPAAASF